MPSCTWRKNSCCPSGERRINCQASSVPSRSRCASRNQMASASVTTPPGPDHVEGRRLQRAIGEEHADRDRGFGLQPCDRLLLAGRCASADRFASMQAEVRIARSAWPGCWPSRLPRSTSMPGPPGSSATLGSVTAPSSHCMASVLKSICNSDVAQRAAVRIAGARRRLRIPRCRFGPGLREAAHVQHIADRRCGRCDGGCSRGRHRQLQHGFAEV